MFADNNYITIQGWMITKLKLKGNELLTYAIVYGFSQDGENMFKGSSKYIADALQVSRTTAVKCLSDLSDRGLLIKTQETINDVIFNRYQISIQAIQKLNRGYTETVQGVTQKLNRGYTETVQEGYTETVHSNNIYNTKGNTKENNKENNISSSPPIHYQGIIDLFNGICVSLPKVKTLNDSRKRAIKNADRQLSGKFKEFFQIIEQSDFLSGRSGNWQGCCFDWILKPSNLTKIMEGNYRNRRERDEECSGSFKDNRFGIDPDKLGIQL